MTSHKTPSKQTSIVTDDDDDDQQNSGPPQPNPKLSVEQGESRQIIIPEAIGLDFNSFIPQADVTSQVHFVSNIQPDSMASMAGLKNGDRILQINGVNVTNLEHEDVRKLMQLMTPMALTVANDPKYLLLLQEPVTDIEEKPPEPPIVANPNSDSGPVVRQDSRLNSLSSLVPAGKSRSFEIFILNEPDESSKEEPLKAKRCRLSKSRNYDGYGLILKYQQNLHVIGAVEEASPSYRAGLRENDVILFVGKSNVEKLSHDDVKVMIRAMALASSQVEIVVISKSDMPRYKTLFDKGLVNWSVMGLEKN